MTDDTIFAIIIVVAYVIGYVGSFVYIAVTDDNADFGELVFSSFLVGLGSISAMIVFKPVLYAVVLSLILFSKLTYVIVHKYKGKSK